MKVLCAVFFSLWAAAVLLATDATAQVSRTCKYTNGQVEFFPYVMPVPIGQYCQNGIGLFGVAVPDGTPSAPSPAAPRAEGTTCKFQSGIFAGRGVDYAWLGYSLPIGAYCQDGLGGTGTVVASEAPTLSRTCRYQSGPKGGSAERFPNIDSVNVGMNCWDGVASFGIAFFETAATQTNTWNGDPDQSPAPSTAEPVAGPAGPAAQQTPLHVAKVCIVTTGANEAALAACMVKQLPENVVQQCAANCNACFGKWDPTNYQCRALTGVAKKLGVDPSKVAKKIDKVWGKIKRLL